MLKSVLSGKKCAECRKCCVFFSCSRWEMPSVSEENAVKIRNFLGSYDAVVENDGVYKMKSILRNNAPEGCEEYRCPALDESKGCTLPAGLKPVECSMWPLRVMSDDGRLYITLATGCHAVDEKFMQDIKILLEKELSEKIMRLARSEKGLVKPYDNSYIKLNEITEEVLTDEQ